jgi:hypothetical protein
MSVVVRAADPVALSATSLRELETRADDILRRAEREAAELLAGFEKPKSNADGPVAAARSSPPTPCQQWLALCRRARFEVVRTEKSTRRPPST